MIRQIDAMFAEPRRTHLLKLKPCYLNILIDVADVLRRGYTNQSLWPLNSFNRPSSPRSETDLSLGYLLGSRPHAQSHQFLTSYQSNLCLSCRSAPTDWTSWQVRPIPISCCGKPCSVDFGEGVNVPTPHGPAPIEPCFTRLWSSI